MKRLTMESQVTMLLKQLPLVADETIARIWELAVLMAHSAKNIKYNIDIANIVQLAAGMVMQGRSDKDKLRVYERLLSYDWSVEMSILKGAIYQMSWWTEEMFPSPVART